MSVGAMEDITLFYKGSTSLTIRCQDDINFLPNDLVSDLFFHFGRELLEIRKTLFKDKKSSWHKLSNELFLHIRQHCRCFLNENHCSLLGLCESQKWSYMRLNTLDVSVTSPIQKEVSIVDEISSQVHTRSIDIIKF